MIMEEHMLRSILPVAMLLSAPLAAATASAQTVTPLQFARGASSATVTGAIKGYNYTDYRVVVRAGQKLSVNFRVLAGSAYFNVMEPGQREVAIYNSSMGEQRYTGTTAHAGAYTIRVYQMRASARRGEVARFQLTVGVTAGGVTAGGAAQQLPSSHAPTHRPGDALVPGTPYHATSSIRCRTVMGGAMGMCKAGVIRRSAGSATVHLDTPDGGERSILFRDGKAVSSDSQAGMSVTRRGDTSVVRIGTVEIYEIPDAMIFGG